MLLCVHVTSVLFLVLAGNSALTIGFYWSYTLVTLVARSYALLVLYMVIIVDEWVFHVFSPQATNIFGRPS